MLKTMSGFHPGHAEFMSASGDTADKGHPTVSPPPTRMTQSGHWATEIPQCSGLLPDHRVLPRRRSTVTWPYDLNGASRARVRPLPTKDGGTLRTIRNACDYMTGTGKQRELREA
jgi:hypothetical protein